ncbi:MAG: hypothetical protein IKL92_07040 [Oscillospiraceae bacterium]|nr:hypothetical protein [Oscillospiraceae bacterium]
MAGNAKKVSQYKGKPLVRSGNTLYYGDPSAPYIAMMHVISNKPFEDITVADKVSVQILSTDESVHIARRVVKHTEKNGLFSALNIASIWLERTINNR